jgi:transposase
LGAINAVSKEITLVTNTTYITSLQVCEMLVKIALKRTAEVPITIVLDNARYQRCKVVTDKAAELGIELLFLPPYWPNLNLIERL